jgi:phosphoribosylformylglycinamidine synthase
MNFSVLQFPASNCDQDAIHAVRHFGHSARLVWHKDAALGDTDCVIVPGGFSYGDYLRCGAIARFSPVMQAVKQFADNGGLVLGVCNGFQVLTEAGLLPGALIRNRDLQFHCENIFLKTATNDSPFTSQIPAGKILRVPIAHGEGCYFADEETLAKLKANNQILWQYCDKDGNLTDTANPNGALQNIAGICNEKRNVAGLMPHPERACEPLLGSDDGKWIFESIFALAPKLAAQSGSKQNQKTRTLPPEVKKALKVFGLDESAAVNDIKSAYRNNIKNYHPDKVAHLGAKLRAVAEAETKEFNSAKKILDDFFAE